MTIEGELLGIGLLKPGKHRLAGTVTIEGEPARRIVRAFNRHTGRIERQAWSNEDGSYEMTPIPAGEYMVIALDHTRTYNAAIADAVVAVPMED